VTIIARIIIFGFLVYHLSRLIEKDKIVSRKTIQKNLITDNTSYVLNESNFDIGIYFNNYDTNSININY
jgi:hypothetical protein